MTDLNAFAIQLAEIIHSCRKMSGLTQHQLADFAGVGKTVVFDLEHGKSSVRLDTLWKVLEVLNVKFEIISPLRELNA